MWKDNFVQNALCNLMKTKQNMSWYTPFVIHKPTAILEIKRAFPAIAFVRIVIAYTSIFLPIRFLLPRWLPYLDVNWLELYFVPMFGYGIIIVIACLASFIPPRLSVTTKGILVQTGQRCMLYRFSDIAAIRVDETTKPFATLRISFLEQQKDKEFSIAPTIPVTALATMINELSFKTDKSKPATLVRRNVGM